MSDEENDEMQPTPWGDHNGLPVHDDANGMPRIFGCLPPRDDFGGFMAFADAIPLIPRSEWFDVDLSPFSVPVLNQGNHGSCVGHGSTSAFWFAYLIGGGTVPPGGFSPTSLYSQINGNRDAGAIVSDSMDALMKTGVGLMADVPESVIYEGQISAAAKAKYSRFRVYEAYHTDTFDAIASALMLGSSVSFGITIRSGFNSPAADGFIQTGGRVLGGHCLCAYGLTKRPDGSFAALVRNSWGESWGNRGNCILPEGHFSGGGLDAFAIRAAQFDPEDPNKPPVVS